jgi:carboxylesterase type B
MLLRFKCQPGSSGDPEKVAIWGESAGAKSLNVTRLSSERATSVGAGSVLQHVVAHNGRTEPQLFRAAITSSTFLPSQYHYNDAIPQV